MYYDYYHHPTEFEQKKKWLIISYVVLAGLIYFFVLGEQIPSFDELPSFGSLFSRW